MFLLYSSFSRARRVILCYATCRPFIRLSECLLGKLCESDSSLLNVTEFTQTGDAPWCVNVCKDSIFCMTNLVRIHVIALEYLLGLAELMFFLSGHAHILKQTTTISTSLVVFNWKFTWHYSFETFFVLIFKWPGDSLFVSLCVTHLFMVWISGWLCDSKIHSLDLLVPSLTLWFIVWHSIHSEAHCSSKVYLLDS